jgi:hypothetical protein
LEPLSQLNWRRTKKLLDTLIALLARISHEKFISIMKRIKKMLKAAGFIKMERLW